MKSPLLCAVKSPPRLPQQLCNLRRTLDHNLLALGKKENSCVIRKSARPTCRAPRTTSPSEITVASQDMFKDVVPTTRSSFQDSHRPPVVLPLANGRSPFQNSSPCVSLPRRVARRVRHLQPVKLHPSLLQRIADEAVLNSAVGKLKGASLGGNVASSGNTKDLPVPSTAGDITAANNDECGSFSRHFTHTR